MMLDQGVYGLLITDFQLYVNRNMQIYTEWANQYLEKNRKNRLIYDLQKDLQNSVILIDLIESVFGTKLTNVERKPCNQQFVINNIATCLKYLSSIGIQLDGVTVEGIRNGDLKSVLNLFYALSWFKKEHCMMRKANTPLKVHNEDKYQSRLPCPKSSSSSSVNKIPQMAERQKKINVGSSPRFGFRCDTAGTTPTNGSRESSVVSNDYIVKSADTATLVGGSRSGTSKTGIGSSIPNGPKGSLGRPAAGRLPLATQSKLPGPSAGQPKTATVKDGKIMEKLKSFAGNSSEKAIRKLPNNEIHGKTTKGMYNVTGNSSSSGFSSVKSEISDISNNEGTVVLNPSTKLGSKPRYFSPELPRRNASSAMAENFQTFHHGRKTVPSKSLSASNKVGSLKHEFQREHDNQAMSQNSAQHPISLQTIDSSAAVLQTGGKPKAYGYTGRLTENARVSHHKVTSGTPSTDHNGFKVSTPSGKQLSSNHGFGSGGIPKPTMAVKGTSKVLTASKTSLNKHISDGKQTERTLTSRRSGKPETPGTASPTQMYFHNLSPSSSTSNSADSNISVQKEDTSDDSTQTVLPGSPGSHGVTAVIGIVSPITYKRSQKCGSEVVNSLSAAPLSALDPVPLEGGNSSTGAIETPAVTSNLGSKVPGLKSSPPHTQSRLETTFECNNGVIITHDFADEFQTAGKEDAISQETLEDILGGLKPLERNLLAPDNFALLQNLTATSKYSPNSSHCICQDAQGSTGTLRFKTSGDFIAACLGSLEKDSADFQSLLVGKANDKVVPAVSNLHWVYRSVGDLVDGRSQPHGYGGRSQNDCDLSAYARRMQDRFREGIAAAESVLGASEPINDSTEESSSSLSSGGSENADETSMDDMTCSSLSDGQLTVSGSKIEAGDSADNKDMETIRRNQLAFASSRDMHSCTSQPTTNPWPQSETSGISPRIVSRLQGNGEVCRMKVSNGRPANERLPAMQQRMNANLLNDRIRYASGQSVDTGRDVRSPRIAANGSIRFHSLDRKRELLTHSYLPVSDSKPTQNNKLVDDNRRDQSPSVLSLVSPKRMPNGKTSANCPGDIQFKPILYQSMSRSMIGNVADLDLSADCENRCRPAPGPCSLAVDSVKKHPTRNAMDLTNCAHDSTGLPPIVSEFCLRGNVVDPNRNGTSNIYQGSTKSQSSPRAMHTASAEGSGPVHTLTSFSGNPCDKLPYHNPYLRLEEARGSSLSLSSTSSSIYSTAEDKYQTEIRKLHKEVEIYKEKVKTLTTQQSTYAHVVAAFEQSLKSMTKRVQVLTAASQRKDTELNGLKQKMEMLREISAAAGINIEEYATSSSPRMQRRSANGGEETSSFCSNLSRQLSSESLASAASENASTGKSSSRHSDKKPKRGWIRSSFSKAFNKKKNKVGSVSDAELDAAHADNRNLEHQSHDSHSQMGTAKAVSAAAINEGDFDELVFSLKKQLIEKDSVLTDIRLEALTSAQQVDQLKEALDRLKNEMSTLKENNQRLQSMVNHISNACIQNSVLPNSELDLTASNSSGSSVMSRGVEVCMRIPVAVMAESQSQVRSMEKIDEHSFIGFCHITESTTWDRCASLIGKVFREYVSKIDPAGNLGLNADGIIDFSVGELTVSGHQWPSSCTVYECALRSNTRTVVIRLRSAKQRAFDSLAFETLIPKPVIQRYAVMLLEQRRIILSSAHAKSLTSLAYSLAEYCLMRLDANLHKDAIRVLNADTINEIIQGNPAHTILPNQKSACSKPSALIINNFVGAESLLKLFSSFSESFLTSFAYIIIVSKQSMANNLSDLQLHHNFRWILCASHMEPMKDRLFRILRQRLIDGEVRQQKKFPPELAKIFDWLPKLWWNLFKYSQMFDVNSEALEPETFAKCPLEADLAKQWFVKLWNETVVPEILQCAGNQTVCQDPASFLMQSWPWNDTLESAGLRSLSRKEMLVKADGQGKSTEDDKDPLAKLIQLQQASNIEEKIDSGCAGIAEFGL